MARLRPDELTQATRPFRKPKSISAASPAQLCKRRGGGGLRQKDHSPFGASGLSGRRLSVIRQGSCIPWPIVSPFDPEQAFRDLITGSSGSVKRTLAVRARGTVRFDSAPVRLAGVDGYIQ